MRTTLKILFFLFFSSSLFGQRLILPDNQENYVFEVKGEKLIKIGKISFPITQNTEIDNHGNAYCLDTANHVILKTNINQDDYDNFIDRIKIPLDINPISLIVYKNNIFIGGDYEKEKIYKFNEINKKWSKLEIPLELAISGKSVDDFLILGDTLIGLDNIVMPKYLLYYDISDLNNIKLIKTYTVPPNGSYESLFRIELLENYFIILSSTFGGSGSQSYVTVLDRYNLPDYSGYMDKYSKNIHIPSPRPTEEYSGFTVTNRLKNFWYIRPRAYYRPNTFWIDIAIKENKILILEKPNRIGKLKIKEKYFRVRKIIGIWTSDEDFTRIIDKRRISFKKLGNKSPRWFVTDTNLNKVILIYQDKNNNYKFKDI